MKSLVLIAVLVAACGKDRDPPAARPAPDEEIAVPGGKVAPIAPIRGDNPAFHLYPDEGTLTIARAEAAAGTPAIATVEVRPAAGFHVSTDFNIKLALTPPPGVTLDKPVLTAGGRRKLQGDAQALSEKQLVFAVRATAASPGTYEITGRFDFGVCEGVACHMKNQPITIVVAAK